MDKLIYRKLSYDILSFFLLSSIAITSIIWVIQGVNLLDIVTEKGHAIGVYFIYSLLNIPKIFSKLLIFTYFLTLFVVLNKYEENNEILVFWTNGIKKISFINYLAKFSLIFVFIQLSLNMYIVPYTQNLAQQYLNASSMEFFPKLLQEKKFSNVMQNLTIFVEENSDEGNLKGIYIKEQLGNDEKKIILAKEGKLIKDKNGFSFELMDGKITNINKNGSFNLGFEETIYELSKFDSKTRKTSKLDEINMNFLLFCLNKFVETRKNENIRCGEKSSYAIPEIYEETFKRIINPIYIIILSLVSSLIILNSKITFLQNYFKIFLFILGFVVILFSELSYKFIISAIEIEFFFIVLPVLLILFFYVFILIKTKFNLKYL